MRVSIRTVAIAALIVNVSFPAAAENPFMGAYIGGGFSAISADRTRASGANPFNGADTLTGWALFGGYNAEILNNIIVGGEVGLSKASHINQSQRPDGTWWWRNNELFNMPYAGLRLGYVWADRIMPYISTGLVAPEYDYQGQNSGVAFDQSVILKDDQVSYAALGMEYSITDNVLGRVEIKTVTFGWPNTATSGTDQTLNSILSGAYYRF